MAWPLLLTVLFGDDTPDWETTQQSYVIFNNKYGVVICSKCNFVISSNFQVPPVERHLSRQHGLHPEPKKLTDVMESLDINYGSVCFDEDGEIISAYLPDSDPVPKATTIAPVQGILISNGFKCQCCNVYYSANKRVMQRHVEKCATATGKDPEFCPCFVQTLRQGPACCYFGVTSGAIISADLNDAMANLVQKYQGFTVADMDAEEGDDYRDANAFRVRMQWDAIIEAMDAKKAVEAVKLPGSTDVPQLLKLTKLVRLWVCFLFGKLMMASLSCRKLLKQHDPYVVCSWCCSAYSN